MTLVSTQLEKNNIHGNHLKDCLLCESSYQPLLERQTIWKEIRMNYFDFTLSLSDLLTKLNQRPEGKEAICPHK